VVTQHNIGEKQGEFNNFTELELLEFKVSMICLATACVSPRRDGR
jgi:hypothetical protein